MNYLILICLIILSGCPSSIKNEKQAIPQVFICPPCNGDCDSLLFDKAGQCPHCGMMLVDQSMIDHEKNVTRKDLTIAFFLQDNIELLDFAGPMEVFRVAGFNVFTVSKTKDHIHSEGALTIVPEYSIADAPTADVMVFFGGSHSTPTNDTTLISWIKSRIPKTQYFISVCTGAFIMGKAGILDGLSATTYHTQIDALRLALPKTKVLSNVRFIDNGRVITTAGISAGIDGALHFVSKIKGKAFALQIAQDIEYDKWIPNQGLIIGQ